MEAMERIQRHILLGAIKDEAIELAASALDGDVDIEAIYDENNQEGELQDYESEFRCSGIDTGLKCPWSRHYESKAVAAKLIDGSWVGWTYWYGGGKHGEPEAIDWMGEAYNLTVTEEEKMVTVRTFSLSETQAA